MYNAKLYHEHNEMQNDGLTRCIKQYENLMKWKDNGTVLDIGCGDGSATATIIRNSIPPSCSLVGCDVSEEMVGFARAHYSSPALHFQLLDIAGPLPPHWTSRFQHVVSFYAMHWVQNQEKAFQNIYDLLDSKGNCLMVIVGQGTIYEGFRKLAKSTKWKSWLQDVEKYVSPYHDCKNPIQKLEDMLSRIGFTNIQITYDLISFQYESLKKMKGGLNALVPFPIPEALKEEFVDDLISVMQDSDREADKLRKSTSDYIHNFHSFILFMEKL